MNKSHDHIDPKMNENSIWKQTKDTKKHRNILPKILQMLRLWLPFWSYLLEELRPQRVFFATCFGGTSGG